MTKDKALLPLQWVLSNNESINQGRIGIEVRLVLGAPDFGLPDYLNSDSLLLPDYWTVLPQL